MSSPDEAALPDRDFDLPIRSSESRVALRINNRSVRLEADRIAWTIDGQTFHIPFSEIGGIHLEANNVSGKPVTTCKIAFLNGRALTIFGSDALGFANTQQASVYRDFIAELHRRLSSADRSRIYFTCGYSQNRLRRLQIALYLTAAGCVAGFGLFLFTGRLKALFLLISGGAFFWRMYKASEANAPRTYAPDRVPFEMLA